DLEGNLYVATAFQPGNIIKVDPAGNTSPFVTSNLNAPQFIAVRLLSPTTSTIQFDSPSYSVNETGGSITIYVTRNGDTSGSATVHYATADGTAVVPADYNSASGGLTFDPGDTSKPIQITVNEETDPGPEQNEGNKTFTVTLSK